MTTTYASAMGSKPFFPGRSEREFLAPALEVMETPPSPLGRTVTLLIVAMAFIGIGWACIGHVDIVAVASGKIIAIGRTKIVQPFETSSVKAILVHPGEIVSKGQPLIELDTTSAVAERERASKDLLAANLDQARIETYLAGASAIDFSKISGATFMQKVNAQAQLTAQIDETHAKTESLVKDQAQKIAERDALNLTLLKLQRTLPLVEERADIRRKSVDTAFGSRFLNLETQQQLVDIKSEIEISPSKLAATDAAIDGLKQKLIATEAETKRQALVDLTRAREQGRVAEEAYAKAARKIDLLTLRSPINGSVQQLNVTTVGSVVTPAQQLLSVVPHDGQIEIEAALENRDIGFVKQGQAVEIKVDAYPFTRYGLAHGKILSVDRDAEPVARNQNQSGSKRSADQASTLEESERLLYTARIAIDGGLPATGELDAQLIPGMSVKAEIRTGSRRIIDYLLSTLSEYRHDGLRER